MKTDDGWCGRRIRKSARQAGSPDPLDVCPVHSHQVVGEVARLSYQLRKRRVPAAAYSRLSRVRNLLVSLVVRLPPPSPPPVVAVSGPAPSFPLRPSGPGVGLWRKPLAFTSGGMLQARPPVPAGVRRKRPSGGVLRNRWPKGLASDPRVAGTFLEGPESRARRARRSSTVVNVVVGPSSGLIRGRRSPSPKADISYFELASAMATMKNKETDAFVEEVRKQAPVDLAALLAGEDWGVMKF